MLFHCLIHERKRYIHHRLQAGKNARQVSSRVHTSDMGNRELQVVLAAHVTPTHSLGLHPSSQILEQKRDCLPSIHHKALASREQNEFMAKLWLSIIL